jgi:hypothetical protein
MYEHAIFIEKSVIDDNQNRIRFLNSKNDIPWQALLKIVQTHYPEYKN